MRITRIVAQLVILLGLASLGQIPHESAYAATASQDVAVSPQYDTTHVYVAPEEFDRFVASLIATFGGTTTKQGVFTVTPTPSSTMSQLVLTPVGSISVFGFKTPIPYPFGIEIGRPSDTYRRIRIQSKFGLLTVHVTDGHLPFPYGRELTGYELSDLADTLAKAKTAGAAVIAGPYAADHRNAAMVQFPGGY